MLSLNPTTRRPTAISILRQCSSTNFSVTTLPSSFSFLSSFPSFASFARNDNDDEEEEEEDDDDNEGREVERTRGSRCIAK